MSMSISPSIDVLAETGERRQRDPVGHLSITEPARRLDVGLALCGDVNS